MAAGYTYDPEALSPELAGLAAGSVGAIAASLIALPVNSPNESIANPVTVTLAAMIIGVLSGRLWRRVRAQRNGTRAFTLAMIGGLLLASLALALVEWQVGGGWFSYGALVTGIVFLSIRLLTPVISRAVAPTWSIAIPVVLALLVATGLFAA
ncbi:MAG: hypothetical protein ABFS21_05035 [Actinomycetota bacterium]